jgi:hypothetical protein
MQVVQEEKDDSVVARIRSIGTTGMARLASSKRRASSTFRRPSSVAPTGNAEDAVAPIEKGSAKDAGNVENPVTDVTAIDNLVTPIEELGQRTGETEEVTVLLKEEGTMEIVPTGVTEEVAAFPKEEGGVPRKGSVIRDPSNVVETEVE